ncbi:MAG: biotin transporter BioY [Sedimentisphaerales bacterium]|jgi:biotin transporter BioY
MQMANTIADVFRPGDRTRGIIYDVVIVAFGALILGFSAQVKVYLPISPVPITGQTFAVLMLAALLGSRRGVLVIIAYLMEGVAGLPVFAGGIGPATLIGPTGGYLFGFIAVAYVVGKLAEMGWDRRVSTTIAAMLAGEIVLYTFGVCWLAIMTNIRTAMVIGLYPFIVGDILKIALAATVLPAGWKLLNYLKIKTTQ